MPSAFLANWLYQDATRSDELVRRNNPIHPLFMLVLIEAFAS
jgi:prophage DNA circulation protein